MHINSLLVITLGILTAAIGAQEVDTHSSNVVQLAQEAADEYGPEMVEWLVEGSNTPDVQPNDAADDIAVAEGVEGGALPVLAQALASLHPESRAVAVQEINNNMNAYKEATAKQIQAQEQPALKKRAPKVPAGAAAVNRNKAMNAVKNALKAAEGAHAVKKTKGLIGGLTAIKNIKKRIKIQKDTTAMCKRNHAVWKSYLGCYIRAIDSGNTDAEDWMCRTRQWMQNNNGFCASGHVTPVKNGQCCYLTVPGPKAWKNGGHDFDDHGTGHGGHEPYFIG